MRRRASFLSTFVGIAALIFATSALAVSLPIKTPDGRIDLELKLHTTLTSGGVPKLELCVAGNLGALGLDNCVRLGGEGLTLTNPPMAKAITLSLQGLKTKRLETYGPPLANASLGSGGITANFNRHGRLTGLSWPGPGMYDHINYLNISRGLPNKGAFRNMGSFGGINDEWLIEADGWKVISQSWASPNTQTLVTKLVDKQTGMRVTITDVVHPTKALVARHFEFSRPPEHGFNYYANMSPTTARAPRIPSVTEALLDPVGDFATIYAKGHGALLFFQPFKVDPTSLTRILTSQFSLSSLVDAVASSFGPGVYIAVGAQDSTPVGYQAGLDTFGLLRSEVENTPLIDPFYDIKDGDLSGSQLAVGLTAGAIALGEKADGAYTIYITAAHSPHKAYQILEYAREQGFKAIRQASERDWKQWIAKARLPATDDQRTIAVVKRALMSIRTAQSDRYGSIMANTTAQTPYRADWPRDGAFFNYALLLAGYEEMAKAHGRFYMSIYRDIPVFDGTWDSFYYADGAEAGGPFIYEVDTQGFAIWGLWLPYAMGGRDRAYLKAVYPAIRDTANALLKCYDPSTGLQCYAPEDDALIPTQGAQGAAAVYLGYTTAIKAAKALGVQPNPKWAARAKELKAAVLKHLCNPGCPGGRGGVYLAWPSGILSPDDPDTAARLQKHYQKYVEQLQLWSTFQKPEIGGYFQYPMEPLMALGLNWHAPNRAKRLDSWMTWLTHDVASPGTLYYAERIFRDGPHSYLYSVGYPHLWSGAEVYIAAVHVYGLRGCPPGVEKVGAATCVQQVGMPLPGVDSARETANGANARAVDAGAESSSASSGGGGGCVLAPRGTRGPVLPLLALLVAAAILGRWRYRHRPTVMGR